MPLNSMGNISKIFLIYMKVGKTFVFLRKSFFLYYQLQYLGFLQSDQHLLPLQDYLQKLKEKKKQYKLWIKR